MTRQEAPRLRPAPPQLLAAACVFLALALLGTRSAAAPAATPPQAFAPRVLEGGEEEVEGEEEAEETQEEFEFEVEGGGEGDGEWLEAEGEGDGEEAAPASILPPECLLRAARPRAVLDSTHETLRLVLAFRAWNPTDLNASFRLQGSRGALSLKAKTRHPSRAGALRLTRGLNPEALKKAQAAHQVVVRLDVPATPPYCHLTLRLPPTRR